VKPRRGHGVMVGVMQLVVGLMCGETQTQHQVHDPSRFLYTFTTNEITKFMLHARLIARFSMRGHSLG